MSRTDVIPAEISAPDLSDPLPRPWTATAPGAPRETHVSAPCEGREVRARLNLQTLPPIDSPPRAWPRRLWGRAAPAGDRYCLRAVARLYDRGLEADYARLADGPAPRDMAVDRLSLAEGFDTPDGYGACRDRELARLLGWARGFDQAAFLRHHCRAFPPADDPEAWTWHLVAMARTGKTDLLEDYRDRLRRGHDEPFPPAVDLPMVERALAMA